MRFLKINTPLESLVHDRLVDLEGVGGGLLEEGLVRDGANVEGLGQVGASGDGRVGALGHEVATELLGDGRVARDVARRAVRFQTPGGLGGRGVEVLGVDALLVLRSIDDRDSGRRSVDEDGRVLGAARKKSTSADGGAPHGHESAHLGLLLELDLEVVLVSSMRLNLGTVERLWMRQRMSK